MQGSLKLKNVATAQWDFAMLRGKGDFVYVNKTDQLDGVTATLEDLDVCDAHDLSWLPLLYQAGYLTIKDVACG